MERATEYVSERTETYPSLSLLLLLAVGPAASSGELENAKNDYARSVRCRLIR